MASSHLTNGNNGASFPSSSLITTSFTPTANALILVQIATFRASSPPTSVVGNGITYTLEDNSNTFDGGFGNSQHFLYRGMSASPTTGGITITGASGTEYITVSVDEETNVDTGGTNGSAAVVQSVSGTSNNATSMSITLAAFGNAANLPYGTIYTYNELAATPGSGFSEVYDGGGASGSMQSQIGAANDNIVDWTHATDDAGAIAIEIKVAGGGGGATLGAYHLIPERLSFAPLTGIH